MQSAPAFLSRERRLATWAYTYLTTCALLFLFVAQAKAQEAGGQNAQQPNKPAQTSRYSNSQLGVSFQPPPAWTEQKEMPDEVLVQYVGPERPDTTRPALNLAIQEGVIGLSDPEVGALVNELNRDMKEGGLADVQILDRRKVSVADMDGLQIDLAYTINNFPVRGRYVYVPVAEHKRTYLFTFLDAASQFDESVRTAEGSIKSFVPVVSRQTAGGAQTSQEGQTTESNGSTILLIVIGLVALAVVLSALYLLLRGRATA